MKSRIFIISGMILMASSNVLGWGQTGHRVIGQIAEDHLSKKARKGVVELLGTESLAMVSNWMDEIRSDSTYDYTHTWHYTTIPDGKTYETKDNDNGQLVVTINRLVDILKDDSKSKQEQTEALKMLVHLVGDLHQPLHVGNGEDRGGNNVKIKFFYESSNLHRIWDSGIIDRKQLSYTELAESINTNDKDQIELWSSGTPADWANEVIQYREQIYNIGDRDNLSYEYVYNNWYLVQQQLLKGGIRLAYILNEIYG